MKNYQEEAEWRARRTIRCLPFRRKFYSRIQTTSINSKELAETIDWDELVFVPFSATRAEEHFEWMIKNGILRREVDGQGLTNRVRLTPLGNKLISEWTGEIPRATIRERIWENLRRHSSF